MRVFQSIGDNYDRIVNSIGLRFESITLSCISIVTYKILIDYIYCSYIGNLYPGFIISISAVNIINGWMAIIILLPLVNFMYQKKTCSSILLVALNLIYFVPITTYCGYGGGSSSFMLYAIIYWSILLFMQIKLPIVTYKFKSIECPNYVMYIIICIISIFIIFIWGKYTNFRVITSFDEIYIARREASNYPLPMILKYIRNLSTIIVPMLILLTLNKKKYLLTIFLLFLVLINFFYAGNKSVLFFPIILIGGFIFYRKNMLSLIFPAGIMIELLAILEQRLGSIYITSFIFRRQGFVLAYLSECYYRFFLKNPTDIFRDGVLGKLGFDSIYTNNMANVIGNNIETQTVNCNNGLLADVWSGLGLIGLLIMPIILIICFRLLDFVSYRINQRLMIGLTLYYAITFANSTWSTVLLTHGFIIMCVILIIFPKEDNELGVAYEDK